MKWVTRANAKVDRVACPWLIRRFIDKDAEFLYVRAEKVLEVAEAEGGHSYDAPGARYSHRDGKCSFEVLIEDFQLDDRPLQRLARIVHGADIQQDVDCIAQAAGLKAIAEGFALIFPDDHEKLWHAFPIYDALYAWCARGE